jgi:hypothetical protein
MDREKLNAMVQDWNGIGKVKKTMIIEAFERDLERQKEKEAILSCFHDGGKGLRIVFYTDFYAVFQNNKENDSFNSYYTGAYFKEGKWKQTSSYAESFEEAVIETIFNNFEGSGTHLPRYLSMIMKGLKE